MTSIYFNTGSRYTDVIESYGLAVCEYESSRAIMAKLSQHATVAECIPLVRLVFVRRNGTFRCSALYNGDIDPADVTSDFFDTMTSVEKCLILDPKFSVRNYFQERADLFYAGIINSPRLKMAQKADAKLKIILANNRADLERSAHYGPHGIIPLGMPKGRKQKGASAINTAIKETSEETGISASNLQPNIRHSVTVDYVDDGHRYIFKFYPAIMKKPHVLVLDRSTVDMYDEVTELFYASKSELATKSMDPLTKKIYFDHFDNFAALVVNTLAAQTYRPRDSRAQAYSWTIKRHLSCEPSQPAQKPDELFESAIKAAESVLTTDDESDF